MPSSFIFCTPPADFTDASLAIANDQLALHRFQLAVFTAVALVFAVEGVNNIYSNAGALIAVGVGWLLLAIVDVGRSLTVLTTDPLAVLPDLGGGLCHLPHPLIRQQRRLDSPRLDPSPSSHFDSQPNRSPRL